MLGLAFETHAIPIELKFLPLGCCSKAMECHCFHITEVAAAPPSKEKTIEVPKKEVAAPAPAVPAVPPAEKVVPSSPAPAEKVEREMSEER